MTRSVIIETTAIATSPCFDHVAVLTPDLDRYRRFYEDVLGLRTAMVERPLGDTYRRLALMGGREGSSSMWVFEVPGYRSEAADDVAGRRGRLDHLGFVTTPAAFETTVGRLVDAGASTGRVVVLGPIRSALFIDPDGAHHRLQTPLLDWEPPASTDVVDRGLLDRFLRRNHDLSDQATDPSTQKEHQP